MLKVRKEIRVCTQHSQEVEKAIKLNKEHNYEYIIVDDGGLVGAEAIMYLLRVGYHINPYGENLEFIHNDYKETKESEL